jgi:hypothetical protein
MIDLKNKAKETIENGAGSAKQATEKVNDKSKDTALSAGGKTEEPGRRLQDVAILFAGSWPPSEATACQEMNRRAYQRLKGIDFESWEECATRLQVYSDPDHGMGQ